MASRACELLCVSSSGNYDNAPTNDIQQKESYSLKHLDNAFFSFNVI